MMESGVLGAMIVMLVVALAILALMIGYNFAKYGTWHPYG